MSLLFKESTARMSFLFKEFTAVMSLLFKEYTANSVPIIINHGQEVYISDIPPAVEEDFGNIPRRP